MSRARRGAALFLMALAGCRASAASSAALCDPDKPDTAYRYTDADVPLPRHLVTSLAGTVVFSDNTPAGNQVTNAGAALGRVLFYDPRLSQDQSLACASCHQQQFGFGDTARFSRGVHGNRPDRRTLALADLRFNAYGRFFWDQRAASLEDQVLEVLQNSDEMGMELGALEARLDSTSYYPRLFAAAFGSPEVTRDGISRALAQFLRSLISAGSRFDSVFATGGPPDFSRLTSDEYRGYQLFNSSGCVNCHRSVLQFADRANNIGLELVSSDTGAGHGRFKPASLRNVAVRPPYMHDGSLATLKDVVRFYSKGVKPSPELDLRLLNEDGSPRPLNLTETEEDQLVAFLGTLTDSAFLKDPRFGSPFGCR